MSTLLSLPREIRDIIIDLVLASPSATQAQETHYRRPLTLSNSAKIRNRIHVPIAQYPSGLNLLSTCRQLHAEAKECARRLKLPYTLDLLIANETYIFPTWISCPPRTSNTISEVLVKLRLAGVYSRILSSPMLPGFTKFAPNEEDILSPFAQSLAHLLRCFLLGGAASASSHPAVSAPNVDYQYSIGTLVIDVPSPPDLKEGETFCRLRHDLDFVNSTINPLEHPLILHSRFFFHWMIRCASWLESHDSEELVHLKRHLGKVIFRLDGKTQKTIKIWS
ncbi:hypothetical protein K505DRAFT_322728 [Melanomma pulvis-pyrius CBS 109.77]|uniref:Uncharacterized protein n=1 Tax=Melanomma pulvis-pyrius CBS 109.77 TaxID=1314802 RepID=A0A6A6XNV0_9PLEO|nr:hypothetical protein K505DRAFT_322728 [Melanomma pulvis-pyrius CBS 109.77]